MSQWAAVDRTGREDLDRGPGRSQRAGADSPGAGDGAGSQAQWADAGPVWIPNSV